MAPAPRTLASVWAAKTAVAASRALGRGGGTAVGGLVGLTLQPHLVRDLATGLESVLITGTNGKTTTARLIAETARRAGRQPIANASGSNLMRGIASMLAQAAGPSGAIEDAAHRLGVIEVDEATIPLALQELRPRAVVFTNLFRDQLDRFGEVEAVAALWREALSKAPADLRLVLNADDPTVASLGEGRANVTYFGVEDKKLDRPTLDHAADARSCLCGAALQFDAVYFGHLGRWRCPACGRSRPKPQVAARRVNLRDGRGMRFELTTPGARRMVEMGIGGLYNAYNALAAAAAAHAIGLPTGALDASLSVTTAAFGRQEAFEVDGRRVELFLAKNPAGANQVLSTLLLDPQRRSVLILLNDGIADGRDISWVWDADFEVAAQAFESVVVSGTRAEEMALRLKYAEWDEARIVVEPDAADAIDRALAATPPGACLSILPTYTAMLEVRDLLAKRTGRASFWQQ